MAANAPKRSKSGGEFCAAIGCCNGRYKSVCTRKSFFRFPKDKERAGEACNHVAALLYALIDVTDKKKDGLLSSTSKKCKWNMPRKRKLSPRKSQHMTFKKHKFSDENDSKTKPHSRRIERSEDINPIDMSAFCERLKECAPHAALLLHNVKSDTTTESFKLLHSVEFMYRDNIDLKSEICRTHFDNYFKQLNISSDDCVEIERQTQGQILNDNWLKARDGRITSSNFGVVCKLKVTTAPDCTLSRIMRYTSFDNDALKGGRTHESAAKRVYKKIIQINHPQMKVHSSGLIVNPNMPHLGASPDALLTCPHCVHDCEGVLEIKCPYGSRFLTPKDAARDKSFFCEIIDNQLILKKNHNYYYQIQGQMAISKRQWCDFFVWTLKGHSVERIKFDNSLWSSMISKLNTFYKEAVIPELHSYRVKRGIQLFSGSKE